MLPPGQAHDLACAEPLIENVDPDALIGDKAYDADPFVEILTQRDITPVIPSRANRKTPRPCVSPPPAEAIPSRPSSARPRRSGPLAPLMANPPGISLPQSSLPPLS